MKKIISLLLVILMLSLTLVSCGNKQFFDTTYRFEYAYILEVEDGELVQNKYKIKSWTDFEDGDQIQVTFEDESMGTRVYHSSVLTLGTK